MEKYQAIILSEEFSTTEVIKLYLSEFGNAEIKQTQNCEEAYNIICNVKENVILIVDLSEDKQDKIDLINRTTKENPKCKVLALSDSPSVNLIIEIMRAGAKEFIPIPIIKNEFFESVRKLITKTDIANNKTKCKIISVFSNKGGLGKTSLATNLALELIYA